MATRDPKSSVGTVQKIMDEDNHPHRSLGHVRLRHYETNEVILVPTPSDDPNDPLRWYIQSSRLHIVRS